jgi:hypothetical protein
MPMHHAIIVALRKESRNARRDDGSPGVRDHRRVCEPISFSFSTRRSLTPLRPAWQVAAVKQAQIGH